jgi:hypothetical protein
MKFWKIWLFWLGILLSGYTIQKLMFGLGPSLDTIYERSIWSFAYVFSALVISLLNYYLIEKGMFKWPKI